MGQIDPQSDFFGTVVVLDAKRRFKVPKSVLDALGWSGPDGLSQLIAEIVDDGRLRLWDLNKVRERLVEIEADIRANAAVDPEQDAVDPGAGLRALRDRYREVTLRPSDGRVQLPVVLHAIIDSRMRVVPIYVELGGGCVEVFSQRARVKRLVRYRGETNLISA